MIYSIGFKIGFKIEEIAILILMLLRWAWRTQISSNFDTKFWHNENDLRECLTMGRFAGF